MNDSTRAFARNMFRLRVFESNGQAYQDLFVRIMQYAILGFRAVRPYGKIGDRGNDGYVRGKGIFYQVYAPDEIGRRPNQAVAKLRHDFQMLRKYWKQFSKISEYHFVINDKYRGAPPNLEKALESLRNRHRIVECKVFAASQLEDLLFSLSDDVIISIIGYVPVITPPELMFLTGLTHFVGVWIEFEKAARFILMPHNRSRGPVAGGLMIRQLHQNGFIKSEATEFLLKTSHKRNRLLHGDSADVPPKEEIDRLVAITKALTGGRASGNITK